MAPPTQQYTLVGFTEDLDWKPLHFVKPLPDNRLCSVCGIIRKASALLPCGHVACHSCYEQCRGADGHSCPMDSRTWQEEDVEWREFSPEKLLIRQVRCWNQRHGCGLMMAASEVHKHFHRECEYHCTPCPRCSAMVLCRDIGEHLRASCSAHAPPQATECVEKPGDTLVTEILDGVKKVVQEQAGEIMNSLKESVRQGIAPVGEISEMTHRVLNGINTLQGALNSEMADIKKQNEELPRVRVAIERAKQEAGASAKTMLEVQKKALAYVEKSGTRCDFFVPGIESLEAKAMKDGEADYYYGPVYLRGYKISPGVQLERDVGSVLLHSLLKLHKGDHDEIILWPFEHKIKCTILHRVENEEKVSILKTNRALKNYKKPKNSSNGVSFSDSFNLGDLKRGGYVCDDMLRVVWELL